MRLIWLIFAALLASVSGASATCPTVFADCPPITAGTNGGAFAGALNLGGPLVNQSGVPFVPPVALPTAGQVVTATDNAGHTAWGSAGTGSVTSMSVVPANGLSGSVATGTTTPALTLSTTVTGLVKGNGAAFSPAIAGTDYLAPASSGAALTGITAGQISGLGTMATQGAGAVAVTGGTIANATISNTVGGFTALNVTGAAGLQIGGATVVNTIGTTSSVTLAGRGAGAALPVTAQFSTFIGDGSGGSFAGTGAAEITGLGNGSCQYLSTTALHDECLGVFSMHYATTEAATVSVGGDNMRNISATSSNTSVGSYGMAEFFGSTSTSYGATSLVGNSASILLTGSATNGDVETLTFTGGGISGGSTTVTRTVNAGDTCTTRAAGLWTAINVATGLINADVRVNAQDTVQMPCVLAIAAANTATIGPAPLTVTYSSSGSSTETATITGGVVANTGSRLNAIGTNSILGYRLTTAYDDNGFGTGSLENLTTGVYDNCGGNFSCVQVTTGNHISVWGHNDFPLATTAYGIAGIGDNLGLDCTTCRQITLLGSGAAASGIGTYNNIVVLTDGSTCNPTYVNQWDVCGGGGTYIRATGTNTAATSTVGIGGNLLIGGFLPNGTQPFLSGDLAFTKTSNTATAPGGGYLKIEVLAGTTGGTCKLVAFAGTSTTPTTIIDNIGSGC